MEALGVAASVIAVIQISEEVFKLCRTYYTEVRDARKDIQKLRDEVSALQDVLIHLKELSESSHDPRGLSKLPNLSILNGPNGPIQMCREQLELVLDRLKIESGKGKMREFGLKALKWPFSSKEVIRIVINIERQKSTFNLALTVDQTVLQLVICGEIEGLKMATTNVQTGVTDIRQDALRSKIIDNWLWTVDPSINQSAALKKRESSTGQWFINCKEFEDWKKTPKSLLWLYGIPGCGKTILSSTIIESLTKLEDAQLRVASTYFFFDFRDPLKQNAINFLSSIVAQLCSKTIELPAGVISAHAKHDEGRRKPALDSLKSIFKLFAAGDNFDTIYVVADALDECPDFAERDELFDLLQFFQAIPDSNVHVLVTSRPKSDIKSSLAPLLTAPAISVQGLAVKADISRYVKAQLDADKKLKAWPDEVKDLVEERLVEGAQGMFLLVSLQLEDLKKCRNRSALLNTLDTLPKTLDDTYDRMLMNISVEDRREAHNALMWLMYSNRVLGLRELADAAAIDPTADIPFAPEDRLGDPCESLLEILGSLVVVSTRPVERYSCIHCPGYVPNYFHKQDICDVDTVEVRLSHFSVKHYLTSERIYRSPAVNFSTDDTLAHSHIVQCCVIYIQHYSSSEVIFNDFRDLERYPLLFHACTTWYSHLKALPPSCAELVNPYIEELFLSYSVCSDWFPSAEKFSSSTLDCFEYALSYAATLGLESTVHQLLQMGTPLAKTENYLWTAVYSAIEIGHEGVIKTLLEYNGTNYPKSWCTQIPPQYGPSWVLFDSPLHHAVERGHEGIVRLLLKHGADVNSLDGAQETALTNTVKSSNLNILQCLLDFGADVRPSTVSLAIKLEQEKVIELLIGHGPLFQLSADVCQTELHIAIADEKVGIVRMLLDCGVDVEEGVRHGRTALESAIISGNKAIVQMLLDHGVKTEERNLDGKTPLILAVDLDWKGPRERFLAAAANSIMVPIVEILLHHGVNPDGRGNKGWTPLLSAVRAGNKDIVQMLLDHGAKTEEREDNGIGPVLLSIFRDDFEILHLLLRHRAQANIAFGILPSIFFANDRFDVSRLLFEFGADIETRDVSGRTLLFNAAISGLEDHVDFLCKLGANANVRDGLGDLLLHRLFWNIDMGQIPLSALAGDSHTKSVAIFQQLLKHGADPLLRSCNGSVLDTILAFEPPRHLNVQKLLRAISHKIFISSASEHPRPTRRRSTHLEHQNFPWRGRQSDRWREDTFTATDTKKRSSSLSFGSSTDDNEAIKVQECDTNPTVDSRPLFPPISYEIIACPHVNRPSTRNKKYEDLSSGNTVLSTIIPHGDTYCS